jgi:hypothetical protein
MQPHIVRGKSLRQLNPRYSPVTLAVSLRSFAVLARSAVKIRDTEIIEF